MKKEHDAREEETASRVHVFLPLLPKRLRQKYLPPMHVLRFCRWPPVWNVVSSRGSKKAGMKGSGMEGSLQD